MRSRFLGLAHVLIGKPVPTFPGHALSRRHRKTAAMTGAPVDPAHGIVRQFTRLTARDHGAILAAASRSDRRGAVEMRRRITMGKATMIGAAVGLAMLAAVPAQAQPVADFYRGKTLRMLIGYGPGGGYDIYGRLVAEFLPRYLPGSPTIVAQNMPGA